MGQPVRTYVGDDAEELTVPCWLCGKPLLVRRTKTDQPYMSCIDCGMQMFVRSTAGAERLVAKCTSVTGTEAPEGGTDR